jgi:hypothetical protein
VTLPKIPNFGPKHCGTCGRRSACVETRTRRSYVRRRYICECGNTWATEERKVTNRACSVCGGIVERACVNCGSESGAAITSTEQQK